MGLLLTKILPPSDTKPPPKTSAHNAVPGSVNFKQKKNHRESNKLTSPFANPK